MRRISLLTSLGLLLSASACSVEMPFDPATVLQPIENALTDAERAFEDAVTDPLNAKPFPVLIGGNDEQIFYSTNLGDVRINFPGPTNDVVVPGFFGPSNLYRYQNKSREMIRPLVPGSTFLGLATDGQHIAYIAVKEEPSSPFDVRVAEIAGVTERIVFDAESNTGTRVVPTRLAMDHGRVAFLTETDGTNGVTLRVHDVAGSDSPIVVEARSVLSFALHGNRLAYIEEDASGSLRVIMRDLATTDVTTLADHIRVTDCEPVGIFLTANHAVWSEPAGDDLSRALSYEIPTAETRVFADTIVGRLVGADDRHIVTEEYVDRGSNKPNLVVVRRYDGDGKKKKLAEFRADGLAGQTTVIGHSAVWVNPGRKIVSAPLEGGDRRAFSAF